MDTLKALLGSKKAVVAIAAIVVEVLAGTNILKLDEGTKQAFMQNVAIIAGAYFGGQGLADMGKEKAKVEKEAKS